MIYYLLISNINYYKVLIRVAKFDAEMAERVLQREEEKSKSLLASIGLG